MPATAEARREIVRRWRLSNPSRTREQNRAADARRRRREREAAALVPAGPLLEVIADASRRLGGIVDIDNRGENQQRVNGGKERFVRVLARSWGVSEITAWRRVARIEKAAAEGTGVSRVTVDEICVAARTHPILWFGAEWERGKVE